MDAPPPANRRKQKNVMSFSPQNKSVRPYQGWGFCGFFRICGFFFSASNLPAFLRISAVSIFPHSNERERERKGGKNACKITLTEPQREMQKNCSQKISLTEPQLCKPLNCERHAQCTLSFC